MVQLTVTCSNLFIRLYECICVCRSNLRPIEVWWSYCAMCLIGPSAWVRFTIGLSQQRQQRPKSMTVNLGNGVTLEFVKIPNGTFKMGSPLDEPTRLDSEGPQHQVSVPSFWMGRYPVTQEQWRAIASMPQVNKALASEPSSFKGDNHPVEHVEWEDAQEFCRRLSAHTGQLLFYRLSSERQLQLTNST